MTSIGIGFLIMVALASVAGFAGIVVGLNKDESMDRDMYQALNEE